MTAYFGPGGNSDSFRNCGLSSTVDAPKWLHDLGLNAYEYEAGNGLSATPTTLKAIGQEARKYNINLSFHSPYFISLSGVDPEKRLKSIDYIRQSLDAANLLGAKTIVVHCGSCAKISRDEAMRLSADTLIKTLHNVDTYGIKIGIETMGKLNQLGTLDEVLELVRIDSSLVPVVDFGHLNARVQGGAFKSIDDYRKIFDSIASKCSDEVAKNLHCHFSKIEWTEKGEKKHLTFDDNVYGPDFEPLIEAIAKDGLTPTIICESSGTQSDDALTMFNYYKNFLGEKQ